MNGSNNAFQRFLFAIKNTSRRKKIMIAAAVLLVLVFIADGLYWYGFRSSKNNDQTTTSTSTSGSTKSSPNDTTTSSLKSDLKIINTALELSSAQIDEANTLLNDQPAIVATTGSNPVTLLQSMQSQGDNEMARRMKFLTDIITTTSTDTAVSQNAANQLSSEAGNEASTLTLLRAKLAEETSATNAANDISQMNAEYPNFAFVAPQSYIVFAAADQLAANKQFDTITSKLSSRLESETAKGKNVQALTAKLDDADAHLTNASSISSGVESSALQVQRSATTAQDRTTLGGYNNQLQSAQNELQSAYNLIQEIVSAL